MTVTFCKGRTKPYRARVRLDGKQVTLGYYLTEEEAREAEKQALKQDPSVADLFDQYESLVLPEKARSTAERERLARRVLSGYMDRPAASITTADLEQALEAYGPTENMARSFRGVWMSIWKWGKARGLVSHDPAVAIDLSGYAKTDKKRKSHVWQTWEEERLWDATEEPSYAFAAEAQLILLYTGMNWLEFLNLKKEDVKPEVIHIHSQKRQIADRDIEIVGKLRPVIERWLSLPGPWFCGQAEKPMHNQVLFRSLDRLFHHIGVDHALQDGRLTYEFWLLARGLDMETINRMLGRNGRIK